MFDFIFKLLSPVISALPKTEETKETIAQVYDAITILNERFGQSRQRVTEFSEAVSATIPLVNKLGGPGIDAINIIDNVSSATKRNVLATGEEVSKLYASNKLTGVETKTLIDSFEKIGVQFTNIGSKVGESVRYIQSIGANTRDVYADIVKNIDKLNQFNFQDGVMGLTRMSTQAQLLKFDMGLTMGFAEQVLNPEKAIEMSSAFQRMGVSVGTLTDPFQLMNKALTDPEGLQNSIIEMTKQFTYFDEQANQFKINPQGMLMLREIGKEMGITGGELNKLAIGAADLDKKLSQISPSFQFENEQDKMYIANIAKLGSGGQYQITVKDEGIDKTISLQDARDEQLQELIERQREGQEGKDVQQIAKDQLDSLEKILAEITSQKASLVLAASTPEKLVNALEGLKLSDDIVNQINKVSTTLLRGMTQQDIRLASNEKIEDIQKNFENFLNNDVKKFYEDLKPTMQKFMESGKNFMEELPKKLSEFIKLLQEKTGFNIPFFKEASYRYDGQQNQQYQQYQNNNYENPIAREIVSKSYTSDMSEYTVNKNINENKYNVSFGEIPVFRIVFSKEPGFDYDTSKFEEIFTSKLGDAQFVEKIVNVVKPKTEEYQSKSIGRPS